MLLGLLLAALDETNIQLRARAWFASADGEFRAFDPPAANTTVDFGIVGLDDSGFGFMADARARLWGPLFFTMGYAGNKFGDTRTIATAFTFEGQAFAAGDRVESELEIRWGKIGLEYDYIWPPYGGWPLHVTPHVGARMLLPVVRLENNTTGVSESDHFNPIVPEIGVRVRLEPNPWLEIGLGITGGWGPKFENTYAYFIEGEVEARVLLGAFNVAGGYFYHTQNLDKNRHGDSNLDVDLHGGFLELGVRF